MDKKSLIFSIWVKSGHKRQDTLYALEQLASSQAESIERGKLLVSTSVNGKSFSFDIPSGLSIERLTKIALDAWQTVTSLTTASELEAYLKTKPRRLTRASVSGVVIS